jgi:hypothetical protein
MQTDWADVKGYDSYDCNTGQGIWDLLRLKSGSRAKAPDRKVFHLHKLKRFPSVNV